MTIAKKGFAEPIMTFFNRYAQKPPAEEEPASEALNQGRGGSSRINKATIISMTIAILIYGMFFGLPYAIGFIVLILIHEMGHVVMLNRLGYRSTSPVFIPFVGALIGMKEQPTNAQDEALVAYFGPFVGSIAAYIIYVAFQWTNNPFFLTLAFTGFIINLFNLIPVSPMDGGRIATAISRWLWLPGLILLVLLFLQIWNPLLLLIIIIGIQRTYQSVFRPEAIEAEGYYSIKPGIRILVSLAYIGLILFLGRLTWISYQQLDMIYGHDLVSAHSGVGCLLAGGGAGLGEAPGE